jgi:hypothetical protein
MSPAAAGGVHVKTARPVEDHLVRVSPVHKVLEKGIDHKEQIGQEESADPLGGLPGKEIARGIKKEFLSRGMARMAALGFDYLSDQTVPGGRQGIVEQALKSGIVLDGLKLGMLETKSLLNDPDDLLLFHDASYLKVSISVRSHRPFRQSITFAEENQRGRQRSLPKPFPHVSRICVNTG